jgi:NAD(P)-dependent dehydrogenase (short-subunit alcohol dehydrogenase family)
MKLKDKVAIITGGGKNIGREISLTLAREGARVVCAGTTRESIEATARDASKFTPGAIAVQCDVSDETAVKTLVETTIKEFGKIDILVNNAGIAGPTALVTDVTLAQWDRTIGVNLTGAFLCSKYVLPLMVEQRSGRIVNISSVAGQTAYPLRSPYSVSKWGMIGLSRTLAAEWGSFNITVNTVVPGPVDGERINAVIKNRAAGVGRSVDDVQAEYTSRTALKRFVTEDDIAKMTLMLVSEEGANITGQVFNVCAGFAL